MKITYILLLGLAASLSTSNQVLVVAGDGGFQMSLNELATFKGELIMNRTVELLAIQFVWCILSYRYIG